MGRRVRQHAVLLVYSQGTDDISDFSLQIVSDAFKGKVFSGSHDTTCITSSQIYAQSTMQRHRMIYSALSDELSQGLHALSLATKTAEEILNTSETQSTNLNDN